MPTTNNEASDIVDIIYKYIGPTTTFCLMKELHEKVGQVTNNGSLRITLAMLLEEVSGRQEIVELDGPIHNED